MKRRVKAVALALALTGSLLVGPAQSTATLDTSARCGRAHWHVKGESWGGVVIFRLRVLSSECRGHDRITRIVYRIGYPSAQCHGAGTLTIRGFRMNADTIGRYNPLGASRLCRVGVTGYRIVRIPAGGLTNLTSRTSRARRCIGAGVAVDLGSFGAWHSRVPRMCFDGR